MLRMLKKLVMISIPLLLLVIVFVRIENQILYWSLFLVLFLLVYIYHLLEDVVPEKDVEKKLSANDFWRLKCGYIVVKGEKAELLKGLLVIYSGQVLFYRRAKASGGAELVYSFPVDSIEGYEIGKVDDFHTGITFTLAGDAEAKFTSKKLPAEEKAIRKAFGWPET